jgi:hypothetical protein
VLAFGSLWLFEGRLGDLLGRRRVSTVVAAERPTVMASLVGRSPRLDLGILELAHLRGN